MRASKVKISALPSGPTPTTVRQRLRLVAAQRVEEILAEIAPTIRRVRMFFLVATICLPVFVIGLVAALWHLAR
jgi:hypothetical protein